MDLSLRSLRKNIAAFSVVALLASLLAVNVAFAAAADVYEDVDGSEWYASYTDWGLDTGVLNDTQAYFRAGDNASRAEFFKMTAAGQGMAEGTCDETLFPDLDASHWACGWITGMADAGIISGDGSTSATPGYVRPNDNVNRSEAAKVVVETFVLVGDGTMGADVFTDVTAGSWYDEYMGIAAYNCVFQGNDGLVRPGDSINRAEAIAVVSRAFAPTTDCVLDTPIAAGALTVSVDGSTPAGVSIPQNGANIPYSVFKFSASADEDINVEQLVISREGLGLPSDFTNLKIYVDGVQKGSEKTISSTTNTATFNLSSDPIVIPAGSSVLVELRADMSGVSGSENQLCIAMAEDVLGYGADSAGEVTVGGTFTACGELMQTTSAAVGTLTYTVSQPSTADINVGELDVITTKVRMDMATEDVDVERITFKQTGSAGEADFANVSLWVSGSMYADSPSWEGDFLTFDLSADPILIAKGNTKTIELHTDIVGGLASTANFDVYRDWHIEGTGAVYGYGVNVQEDPASITPSNRNIVGGNVAFSLSSNNPVTGDVKQGANDHDFTRFNVSTGGDGVTVRKISLTVNGGLGNTDVTLANIDDVKIWTKNSSDEWYVVAGPNDITSLIDPETVSFTDTFDIPAAVTQEFMVTADVANAATATDVYDIDVADVTVGANTELEYLSDGTPLNVATEVTGGMLNGNAMTVNTPTLTVALSATPGDKFYVRNTVDKDLVAFDMTASTADDLRVTGMVVTCAPNNTFDDDGDGALDEDITNGVDDDLDGLVDEDDVNAGDCATAFQSLYLYEKDGSTLTEIDGPRSMSASGANGTITFSFNQSVDAGATSRLLLRGNLASGAISDGYSFNISSVTAEDTDSSAATIAPLPFPLVLSRVVGVAANGAFTDQGISDASLSARVVAGLSTDEPVMQVRFDASELEAWYIKKMNFDLGGSANDADISKIYVNYTDQNDDAQVASGVISGGTVTFEGMDIYVPAGGNQVVDVTLDMGDVATGGALAGEIVILTFDATTPATFEAIGASSATAIAGGGAGTADVVSHEFRIAKSFPTVVRNEGLSNAIGVGDMTAYEFTMAADEAGDVAVKKLTFAVGVTGATVGAGADIYRDGTLISDSTDVDVVYAGGSGNVTVTWNDLADDKGEDVVGFGSTVTYKVVLHVTAVPAASSISTSLVYDSIGLAGSLEAAGGNLIGENFVWSDKSITPHSSEDGSVVGGTDASTSDWLNGYLVSGLSAAGSHVLSN